MYRYLSVLCVAAALAGIGAWGLRAEALRSDEMKAPDTLSSEFGTIPEHDSLGAIVDTPLGEPADPSMIFLAPDDVLDADAPRNDQVPASASDEDELAPSVSSAPADEEGSAGEAGDFFSEDEAGDEGSAEEGSADDGSADDGSAEKGSSDEGSSDDDSGDESDADGDGSLSPDDTGSTHDPDDDVDSRDPDDIGGAAAPRRGDDDQGEDDPQD